LFFSETIEFQEKYAPFKPQIRRGKNWQATTFGGARVVEVENSLLCRKSLADFSFFGQ